MPASNLAQTYALDRAATGIGDCAITSLKVTDWERICDSEMNIAIEQTKTIYVHINPIRAQSYPSDLEINFVPRSKHCLPHL